MRAIHESPVTLFALFFGFVQTNAPSQTSVGEGLAPPVLCPHYLSASIYVRTYQKPSSERKGDHEVVEGACVTIKIVLSSPLRTLPQSLRDSSLSEGAFEKFAAICLFSPFFMDSEATCCPDALSLQCVGVGAPPYCFVLAVCFIRAIRESPATLFAPSFGGAQTNDLHRSR